MRGLFFGGALAGVLLGFGLGLAVAWSYWPVPFWGATPADLRLDLKDDYLRMIASSYSLDGDLARSLQRLDSLKLAQPGAYVTDLVQREPKSLYQQALIHLALDLRQPSAALARPTFTPRPIKTRTQVRPFPTILPQRPPTPAPAPPIVAPSTPPTEPVLPPATQVPNPDAPFFLIKSRTALYCSDTGGGGLVAVDVEDADGRPLPGIGVELNWGAGDQVFYTGFKPERGMGYADVDVSPGTYNVRLTGNARSDVVVNLRIDNEPSECLSGAHQVRGWNLVFQLAR